jgi:microcystin-dependent protein
VPMYPNCVLAEHQGGPHYNMQPYLTINFIIALVGTYPPRD